MVVSVTLATIPLFQYSLLLGSLLLSLYLQLFVQLFTNVRSALTIHGLFAAKVQGKHGSCESR